MMSGQPRAEKAQLVSVVIPSYNAAGYITTAIESVFAQSFRPFEIIVVDDGSTDNTREALAPYQGRITYRYQENRGVSAARNEGIRHARGELIALLDADDIWSAEKLALQVKAFCLHPEAGLCFTDNSKYDAAGILQESSLAAGLQQWISNHRERGAEEISFGPLFQELLQRNCIHTSTILARREVLEAAGLFDETFRVCEDYDLWLRIARLHPFLCVNRVLCGYRFHPEGLSGSMETRAALWNLQNIRVLEKHLRNRWIPREYEAITRQVLGRRSFFAGWNYFSRNQFREARSLFLRSVQCEPFRMNHWVYWIATMLPLPMIDTLRWLKRGGSASPEAHA